jgi:UDP-N-acetylglucosamine acyltransferase
MMIHPTAIISKSAVISDGVEIGPYTVIGEHVDIGACTKVDSHVVINGPTKIGENNHIYQFASIGDDPQDKKYRNEQTRLEIGNRNTIREYCSISRGTAQDKGVTKIGDDNWIMAYVHIAHDCLLGNKIIMANNTTLAGHVHVGDWVIFAGFAGAHQFCHIGAHSFLGMYSGVNQDVPAYVMVFGLPGAPAGINSEGLKRRDFSKAQIRNIKNAYRIVYRDGLKLAGAISQIEHLVVDQPELELFLESLKTSERGVIR